MKALADFKTKKVVKEGYEKAYWDKVDGVYGYDGFETPITTMDEFKAAVSQLIGDGELVYFTDYKGNLLIIINMIGKKFLVNMIVFT